MSHWVSHNLLEHPASDKFIKQSTGRKVLPLGSPRQPDKRPPRWGDAVKADQMKNCVWLRPERVAQVEFLEWTSGVCLRHARFVGLRADKEPREVVKEHAGES